MALRRVGLSWWREGLGGGEVQAPPPEAQREADAALAGITQHFSRVLHLEAGRAVPRTRRATEYQYRGPDLTKTLPPALKARPASRSRGRAGRPHALAHPPHAASRCVSARFRA
jgi:hypothetical protein